MIVHTRIDNRLLHGIVATQWAPKSGCTRVMIIDDATANDSILKESMKLGRPAGNAISIITVDSAIANFKANKYEGQKVFIVVKEVDTLEKLIDNGIKIDKINVGGTVKKENAIALSKRAYADEHDVVIYRKLLDKGINITVQYLVTDKEVNIADVL